MNCPIPNEHLIDRLTRALLGMVAAMAGYFWLWGYWQILTYAVALAFLGTAAVGYCHLYKLLRWDTTKWKAKINPKLIWPVFTLVVAGVVVGGGYASAFFSRKFFIEDFNRMNGPYKQTLFTTGQNDRASAISNYGALVAEYARFTDKYSKYHPYFLRSDALFAGDIKRVGDIVSNLDNAVHQGDLPQAHLELEKVRPIFQDMLKRNGFSMLAVYLVDFHDSMEKVLDAAVAKDPSGVIQSYADADAKLKEVETLANDQEIQNIRTNLERVKTAAQQNETDKLPGLGADLKSSFVKVYLARG